MQLHEYVGMMFLAASIGHLVMIAAIVGGVMRVSGRVLVSVYLLLDAAISFSIAQSLFAMTGMEEGDVVSGIVLSTAYAALTFVLVGYGVLRALQGRRSTG